ncbi:MAG: hypothetical protein KOO62_02680 [candidate division Zixibacteria bacterium]|nr:hypothetical protein [candidate division Zixibacteria bacterium]
MKHKVLLILCLLITLAGVTALAQEVEPPDTAAVTDSLAMPPPAPPSMVEGCDVPNDHGHAIDLTWEISADDGDGQNSVLSYEIFRWIPSLVDTLRMMRQQIDSLIEAAEIVDDPNVDYKELIKELRSGYAGIADRLPEAHTQYPNGGDWVSIKDVPMGTSSYTNAGTKDKMSQDYIPDYSDLYYRIDAVTIYPEIRSSSEVIGPVQCYGQWFNTGRIPVFVAVLFFCSLTIFFVQRARKGADLYVRPISGIEAVDDAIGRATEMGRPILYVLGLGTAADVATIASFTILSRVAKRVAEYQTELIVPTYDPIVMSVAQEVVKSAYLDAGRADNYNEDIVFFVTQSQFAYVAAVNGIMLRQYPATNVYMGMFHAESLLLAETGTEAGSIQIAGTDQIAQLPFFIVACDYTLIGEELYAASAYLGKEPVLLGSLKAQDYAKAAVLVIACLGLLAGNFGFDAFIELFHVTD